MSTTPEGLCCHLSSKEEEDIPLGQQDFDQRSARLAAAQEKLKLFKILSAEHAAAIDKILRDTESELESLSDRWKGISIDEEQISSYRTSRRGIIWLTLPILLFLRPPAMSSAVRTTVHGPLCNKSTTQQPTTSWRDGNSWAFLLLASRSGLIWKMPWDGFAALATTTCILSVSISTATKMDALTTFPRARVCSKFCWSSIIHRADEGPECTTL
eukprot:m.93997 g.93997  ORF g.93997 m.93997 type:complete len:214 (+) comp51217_c0_seq1:30-671(+)